MANGNGCLATQWVIQSPLPLNKWLYSGITYGKWYNVAKGCEDEVLSLLG